MKVILAILVKDIKIRIRDVRFIFTVLLLPLILIFFISSTFSLSSGPFKAKVATLILDENLGKIFIEDVLQGKELKDIIEIINVNSVDEGKRLCQDGVVSSFIYIDKDFSQNVFAGSTAKIQVYGNPNETIKPTVIKEIADIFALKVMENRAILNGLVGAISNSISPNTNFDPKAISSFFEDLTSALSQKKEELLTLKSELASTKTISSTEYYTIGMGVMYIMFATNMFSEAFFEERRYNTLNRLLTTSLSKTQIFIGKIFGVFSMGLIEILVIILFSYFVYGVRWGNILNVFIVTVVSVFTFASFSLLLASLVINESGVSTIGPIIALVFGFLGGSMWPTFLFPDFLKKISMFIPNRWALDSYLSVLYGDSLGRISNNLIPLLMFGLFFLILGIVNFSRREYV